MDRSNHFPPGPAGSLVFGHYSDYSRNPLGFLTQCSKVFGDISSFRLPGARFYLLTDPEDISEVFTATNSTFINHGGMRTPLSRLLFGGGLLTSEGDEWRRQRKLTFPSFRHSRIPQFAEMMIEETRRTVDSWKFGDTIELFDEMTMLTLRTFMRTLLRSSDPSQHTEITRSFFALRDGFLLKHRIQSFGMICRLPIKRKYRLAIRRLDSVVENIISQRRSKNTTDDDLLSVLMAAEYDNGRPISENQLRSEVKTFLFTGIFGAALPLAWALYSIARDVDVQKRLETETERICGNGISSELDLKDFGYARWILKETLRLYPPIWATGREAAVECEIGGYFVPKGTQMILSQWVTQRDPRFWTEPQRFDPSRWSQNGERPKYSYFPHGGGPRFCMGDAFAELLSVIVLSSVARRVTLTATSKEQVNLIPSYALFPDGPVHVVVGEKTAA